MAAKRFARVQVRLSQARSADLPLLLKWMRALRIDDPMPTEKFVGKRAAENATGRLLRNSQLGRIWIIRAGQNPAGYIVLTFAYSIELAGRIAFIDEFFITRDFRGQGIGQRAMELAVLRAQRMGLTALLLEVTQTNRAANALYRRAKFSPRKYRLLMKWLK